MEVGGKAILGGVCEAGKVFSCDAVLSSKWSEFAGHPTALWGYFFFSVMSAWYIVVGRPTGAMRGLHSLVLLGTGLATLGVIGLAFVMYVKIGKICPFCAADARGHRAPVHRDVPASAASRRNRGCGGGAARRVPAPTIETSHPTAGLLAAFALLAAMTAASGWTGYQYLREKAYAAEYRKRWESYEADLSAVYLRFMEQP